MVLGVTTMSVGGVPPMNPHKRMDEPSLYSQPLAVRFGTELLRDIGKGKGQSIEPFWDSLDIAVAWVRESGTAYLAEPLARFLGHGGRLCVIAGIDLENTTQEGLQALLDLEQHGRCETYVYHNESGSIFHPKVYLFRNEEEARLIVGSNNITQAGLYTNVEAGLQVETNVYAKVITQVLNAVKAWKNTDSQLALRLDSDVLNRLIREGYVPDESSLRTTRKRRKTQRNLSGNPPLFGTRRYSPPPRPEGSPAGAPTRGASPDPRRPSPSPAPAKSELGAVVLMRLRKASATGRPTQTQLPFRVVDTFFGDVEAVRSAHSNQKHPLIEASAGGARNTVKLEIPEMRDFLQPVARFHRTADDVVYETYDAHTSEGIQIMESLQAGRRDGSTQLTVNDANRATWWRFI